MHAHVHTYAHMIIQPKCIHAPANKHKHTLIIIIIINMNVEGDLYIG